MKRQRRKSIGLRRLQCLAEIAAKRDSKILERLIELAMYWENDVGYVVDEFFSLPHPPSTWKELGKWRREWNKKAKQITGF